MEIGTKVKAVGYKNYTITEENKDEPKFPEWLEQGTHQVSDVRYSIFGTYVKTDRQHDFWMNSDWFVPIT